MSKNYLVGQILLEKFFKWKNLKKERTSIKDVRKILTGKKETFRHEKR